MKIDIQAFLATGVPQTVIIIATGVILSYFAIKIILKMDFLFRLGQFLEWLNSKSSHYYGVILAVLAANLLGSIRAGGVYYIFFHASMENQLIFGVPLLLWAICGVATMVVFFCGYYVATHRPTKGEGLWFLLVCLVFIAHDCAGILVSESVNAAGKSTVEISAMNLAGWAFCALSTVPLILGRWLPKLKTLKDQEEQENHANFAKHHTHRTQKYAIQVISQEARKVPRKEVWRFLPQQDQALGKQILEIAGGKYKDDQPALPAQPVARRIGPRTTGPIPAQIPGPIDRRRELPFTPAPVNMEDEFEEEEEERGYPSTGEEEPVEEEEIKKEDLEEEDFKTAAGNFIRSVRSRGKQLQAMIQKH